MKVRIHKRQDVIGGWYVVVENCRVGYVYDTGHLHWLPQRCVSLEMTDEERELAELEVVKQLNREIVSARRSNGIAPQAQEETSNDGDTRQSGVDSGEGTQAGKD